MKLLPALRPRAPQPAFYWSPGWAPEGESTPPGDVNDPGSGERSPTGGGPWRDPEQPFWGSVPPPSNRLNIAFVPVQYQLAAMDGIDKARVKELSSRKILAVAYAGPANLDIPPMMTTGNNPTPPIGMHINAASLYGDSTERSK